MTARRAVGEVGKSAVPAPRPAFAIGIGAPSAVRSASARIAVRFRRPACRSGPAADVRADYSLRREPSPPAPLPASTISGSELKQRCLVAASRRVDAAAKSGHAAVGPARGTKFSRVRSAPPAACPRLRVSLSYDIMALGAAAARRFLPSPSLCLTLRCLVAASVPSRCEAGVCRFEREG